MAPREAARRLIVNADDFGLSPPVNQAVIQAHRQGILTSASLMVNEPGFDEAVALARENPKLGVGLHLTFSHGHAALPPAELAGMANERGELTNDPVGAGWRYFAHRRLREPLRRELRAQFAKFRATGLPLDHVNGHLHFHLHPVILGLLLEDADALEIRRMRLTRDPFWLNAKIAPGHWVYRAAHAAIYWCLAGRARRRFWNRGIRHTSVVFGLLQNARVDEEYVLRLLARLPPGDSELYSHPSLGEFKHEYDALVSDRVRAAVQTHGIQLIRYQDLN